MSTQRIETSRALLGLTVCAFFGTTVLAAGCRVLQPGVKDTGPQACAECHVNIARQWACSPHAEAWTDPLFAAETKDFTEEQCLPCHAPTPVLAQEGTEAPGLRDRRRDNGVDCHSCHYTCGSYAGPYNTWGPHAVKQTTRMRHADFCGGCHTMEHQEYTQLYVPSVQSPKSPRPCADCHMPPSRARSTQGHILSLAHPKRTVRDHSFPAMTTAVIRGAVTIDEAVVEPGEENRYQVDFTVTNRGAGHRVPTGGYGHREVRLLVELLDAQGEVAGHAERSLFSKRTTSLAPGEPTDFSLTVQWRDDVPPARARLIVERVNKDRTFRRTLARRTWALD